MSDLQTLYKRADDAFVKRNYAYAQDLYLQIIGTAPNESEARRKLYATILTKFKEQGAPSKLTTKIFLGGGTAAHLKLTRKPEKRAEIAQKALLSDPTNDRVRTALADALLELGHPVGALEEARIAVECKPENAEANKLMARIEMQQGNVEEAKQALLRAHRAKPDDREAEKLLRDLEATATMKKGFDSARSYRDVIKDQDQASQLERKAHLVKTEADVQALLREAIEAHKADPQEVKLVKQIADLHLEARKDFAAAKEWFKKAVALAPHDSVLKDKVEDCDIRAYSEEIKTAKKAGNASASQMEARLLQFETKAFERRVADRPTDMSLRYELGIRLYKSKRLDEAIREFQNAVRDPRHKVDASIYLGNCFQAKKLYDLAEAQYRNAETGAVALGERKLIYILYQWGRCCEESGKKAEAVRLYTRIVEVDYGHLDAAPRLERLKKELEA